MSEKPTKNSGRKSGNKSTSGKWTAKEVKSLAGSVLSRNSKDGKYLQKPKATASASVARSSMKSDIARKKTTQKDTSYKDSMTAAQWKRFNSLEDKDIDTSDIPELDKNFWKNAKVVVPKHKKAISLRVDEDVLDWFKEQGKGYQSFMNAILRSYYESHDDKK